MMSSFLSLLCLGLPSAALLWLAASVASKHHGAGQAQIGAAVLAVAALWWPLQSSLVLSELSPGAAAAWSISLAVGAASLVVMSHSAGQLRGRFYSGPKLAWAAGSFLIALLALCLASTPVRPLDTLRVCLGAVVLTAALHVLANPLTEEKRGWRLAAALGGAAVLAWAGSPGVGEPAPWTQSAFWLLGAVLALGATLRAQDFDSPFAAASDWREPVSEQPAEVLEDPLTRLPTRNHFETQLAAAVVRSDSRHVAMALLFIDLDGFKPVNDTFGHGCGDQVLSVVGERLKLCAHSGDAVARVGGDEFLLLMADASDAKRVAERTQQVVNSLSEPYVVEGRHITISCSIGVSLYPTHGQHAKLVARADAAMYATKRAGGSGYAFYTPALEEDARERFDLLRDLRKALDHKELELFYQPKIDATTGKVTAAEALIRWNHPTRGLLSPSVFLPLAERFGLIRSIGHWVIEDACRQARVWQDSGLRMRVAINLSALQMRQDDIVERIQGSLARHRIDPRLLTCEITESVAMEDTRATQSTFRELGAAGIHLSIDDFGTGYSSLAYLRKLPAEELKIDRSFVMDVEFSQDARTIVDAVVKLAHAMGLKVVAEGIENERQKRVLVELGCDELQGFLFAKPMTARALLLWAIDDRQSHSDSFATSLFESTHERSADFASTRRDPGRAALDAVQATLVMEDSAKFH